MKLHFLGMAWCVGVAAGWLTLHKGVEEMVGPATPDNDTAFLDGNATTDPPSLTDGTVPALPPNSPPSNAPTPDNPNAPTPAQPPAPTAEQAPVTDTNTSFIPNTSTPTADTNMSSLNVTSPLPNPVPETKAHRGHTNKPFLTPVLATHTKTSNHSRDSVLAPTTSPSTKPAAKRTTQKNTQDPANTLNSTDLTNKTHQETTTDATAATSKPQTSTRKLWRGMKCESMQWKDAPDCVVAMPSQVFYPWDVFRTTYEVIMAELKTRYTALPLNTPELDGVRVYCKGMEELKLALRWCYLLVPSARAIVPMPQASVSFHLDKGRYTFAEKWMYKAVEVRCPSTPSFWIRRSDPIRCASVNHTCLDDTTDYLDELDKTAIPEAINVPPSW